MSTVRQAMPVSTGSIPYAHEDFLHIDPFEKEHHIYIPLEWKYKKYPHALLIGGTGSGKTTALKQITAAFINTEKDSEIFLCTFKHKDDDFPFLTDSPHFASYAHCGELFEAFYSRFLARLNGDDSDRNLLLLVFDEWAGFLLSLEKKDQEEKQKKLGQILMMGRSMNIQVIVAMQRPDAQFFKNGARDNFNLIIALGNLSDDGIKMVFSSGHADKVEPCVNIGEGYSLVGGSSLYHILIPYPTEDIDIILEKKLKS